MRTRDGADPTDSIRGWLTDPADDTGIYLADEAGGWLFRPYRDIAAHALAIAERMVARGVRGGDGVCVVMPTDFSCAAAFYAVWACGGVFTPITPPTFGDLDEYIDHVAAILEQARPAVVITSAGLADIVATAQDRAGKSDAGEPLVVDDVPTVSEGPVALGDPGACALLQFTSGSTGRPRGVQISWQNLATNTTMISDLLRWRPGEAMASWLPLYHDMGLVGGFLTTVTNQEDLYLMRPDQFVRDPARWLHAMTVARHTPSPSFALGYLAHRVGPDDIAGLDLRGWRTLAVGSEPVETSDLAAFTALVEPLGFDIDAFTLAYGLAESTLMVSSSERNRPITLIRPATSTLRFGRPVSVERTVDFDGTEPGGTGWIAGLGRSIPDSTVGVVDDDGQPLPDGVLGEVTVTGGSVALGYTDDREPQPGSTRLADGVLYTGDAGFLLDGEIFVLGRMGSSLKVRGRSVFAEDIESRVSTECGLTKGKLAAVAVTDASAPGVALFAEVSPGEWIAKARTIIRAQLGPAHGITVITGPRGLICRTSSGKPRRRHMWRLFGDGALTGAVTHEADGSSRMSRPEPALAEERLTALLDAALASVTIPDDCAVVFEGSLAEGFGNEGSDVDFLVIAAGDEQMPTLPSVLFADGRRVEIRTRSAAQLHDQLTTVARAAADGRIADLDEDVLNRCQRFLRSTTVRESAAVDTGGLRDLIDDTAFAATVAQWWRGRAAAAMGYATVMRALGAHDEAAGWATDALVQAAKAWAARHRETYLESKWLPQQLARASAEVADRYRELLDMPLPEPASDAPWWDPVADAVRDLGGDLEWPGADDVVLARVPGVTTWQTGDRIHVIRGGRDVFALSDAAGRAWRQVVFRHSVAAVVERADGSGVDVASALAEFVRLGLVGLDWRGRGPLRPAMAMCEPAEPYTPTPFAGHPILGLGGATRPGPPAVPVATLSPLPADRFASAALDLTWANVVTENAREDLVGALKSGQGAVADVAAHRLVAMTARMVLAAYGIAPLPADVAPVATLSRLVPADTPGRAELLTAFRAADAVRFAPLLAGAPGGDGDAARALEALDALVDRVRSTVVGIDFPASFDSRDQWRRTLEISYDWLRIGTHLGVRLPLAEAGDLLATGGAQPHVTDQGGGR